MKRALLSIALISISMACFAQAQEDFDAEVARFRDFYNHEQTDSIYNMLSDRGKELLPLDKTTETFKQLHAKLGEITTVDFSEKKDVFSFYKTVFSKNALAFTLVVSLDKGHKLETFQFVPYTAAKSNIVLKTATGDICGTLAIPEGTKEPPPVVLIIAGSGPTDRDGNNPLGVKAGPYKMLADSLLKAGIASVRYDKRGIGESVTALKREDSLSFNDMVNDAAGFIKKLAGDKRFSKVIVLGHSEGSLIGMIAAAKEKAAGYISVAGLGERADKVIIKQMRLQSQDLAGKSSIILDSLIHGYTVKNIDSQLIPLFHESLQRYLRSWLKYDPALEIAKLKIPVLILQGTTDIQVSVNQAQLLKNGAKTATVKILVGMNHVLKQSSPDREQNIATYSNPDLPLSRELAKDVVSFVNDL